MVERSISRCRLCPTRGGAARLLLALVVSVLGGASAAAQDTLTVTLTPGTVQPGTVVVATIDAPAGTTAVSVTAVGGDWPAFRADNGQWRALVGVDMETTPGQYPVVARSAGTVTLEHRQSITVARRQYRRRVLKVAPEYVNPPAETLERIAREAEWTRQAYSRTATEPGWRDGFVRPVAEPANSSFGTRSVFNGESRSPHAGTDFLSPTGTPIHAPAAGRVVLARDLFFTGNTVIIDHGLGVFSMLAHLSRIDVEEAQDLDTGEVVGLVGATGRVTGPHLHWALRVGGARVDPLSALERQPRGR